MTKLVKKDLLNLGDGVKVVSESTDKVYKITLISNPADREKVCLKCTCPSWRYNNNPKDLVKGRVCKHIQQFLAEQVHPNTRRHLAKGIFAGLRKVGV